jgi:integrase
MASLHKRNRSPFWWGKYKLADGRYAFRSTGELEKARATEIVLAWQYAENLAAKGEATEQRLKEVISETLRRLGHEPITTPTVRAWLDDWTKSCEHSTKPATLIAYQQAVRDFCEYLGPMTHRPLTTITQVQINGFRDYLLAEHRSAGTVNKLIKKYLNTPFELARKSGKISLNPINLFKTLKVESGEKGRFTPEQVARLVAACDRDDDWKGAILFAYGSGARLQDVANLRWSNLDTINGIVQFKQRKTGAKTKPFGIHPDFEEWLISHSRADDDKSDGPVFPSLANRSGAGRNGLSKAFDRIMVRAGITSALIKERSAKGKGRSVRALSFHSFRHNAPSEILNAETLKAIASRVTGHAPDGSIDRYLHLDLETIKATTQLIPRLPKKS